jgi:nucleoside-diphosphate-sugar epimerase
MFIVTGGTGIIGSAIVLGLNRLGVNDIIIIDDMSEVKFERLKNIECLSYDSIIDRNKFEDKLKNNTKYYNVEGIFHINFTPNHIDTDYTETIRKDIEFTKLLTKLSLLVDARFAYLISAQTPEKYKTKNRFMFECWISNREYAKFIVVKSVLEVSEYAVCITRSYNEISETVSEDSDVNCNFLYVKV